MELAAAGLAEDLHRVGLGLAARALSNRGGDSGVAASQLLTVLEARREAQSDAREILAGASKDGLPIRPLILGEAMDDPTAAEIARWLIEEGAA